MTTYVMHREVCLKHRKNRREIFQRVRTQVPSWQRCLFFFVVCGAVVTTRAALCGHRPRAGCLNANQAMPVQFRLTAPFFRYPQSNHTTCAAGASLRSRASKTPRARGSTETPCHFFKSRGSQVGRQRPHKPSMSGFDSRPRHQFHGPLDHSGGHSPRKRESTVQSRGGPLFFQIAGRLRTRGVS
jgi:hypothetical protein